MKRFGFKTGFVSCWLTVLPAGAHAQLCDPVFELPIVLTKTSMTLIPELPTYLYRKCRIERRYGFRVFGKYTFGNSVYWLASGFLRDEVEGAKSITFQYENDYLAIKEGATSCISSEADAVLSGGQLKGAEFSNSLKPAWRFDMVPSDLAGLLADYARRFLPVIGGIGGLKTAVKKECGETLADYPPLLIKILLDTKAQ